MLRGISAANFPPEEHGVSTHTGVPSLGHQRWEEEPTYLALKGSKDSVLQEKMGVCWKDRSPLKRPAHKSYSKHSLWDYEERVSQSGMESCKEKLL